MQQFIGFRLHGGEYAIPILKVREIIDLPRITPIPTAPAYLRGITNLRGTVIPVVDTKRLVQLPENGSAGTKVIVIASGRLNFGILVDSITGVVAVEDSALEPPGSIPHSHAEQVLGVAKLSDRLIIILDPRKLIPLSDVNLLEETVRMTPTGPARTEVTRILHTSGGDVRVTEIEQARESYEKSRGVSSGDPRHELLNEVIAFLAAVAEHDFDRADGLIDALVKRGQGELFREVGKITRKLHDSVKSFKDAVDPKLRDMAHREVPNAVDRLQFVIAKTEEAANKTMSVVEKYILKMDKLAAHVRKVEGPEETVAYLKQFKNGLEDDLTEVLTAQSFQDLTGQTIKKVIALVKEIEEELVRLIATFGVKIEAGSKPAAASEKVSQADVDDLLKEFGF